MYSTQIWSFNSYYFIKYFLIYTHFAVGKKGVQNVHFHLSTVQNSHLFKIKYLPHQLGECLET